MKWCSWFIFFAALLVSATVVADVEEVHTWTSANGEHSVEASLVDSEYDRQRKTTLYILRRTDGTTFKVPSHQLSKESHRLATRVLVQRRSASQQKERQKHYDATQKRKARKAAEDAQLQAYAREAGKILPKRTPHGSYMQYIPPRRPLGIIVVVHGMLGEKSQAIDAASTFIKRWVTLAEQRGAIILAPAFDQENFGGYAGPGGGYRGLFGREIGADDFVHEIVGQYQMLFPSFDGKFMLYGHSAGGQFVSRYLVKHPDRIIAAVISAAGTFAFPNPNWPWTDGMARLTRKIRWRPTDAESPFDFQPDPRGWLKAATLPVTVVVGSQDVEASKPSPSQKGNNHVERAQHWVEDMNALARREGRMGNVQLVIVPGVGHSSSRLRPVCQTALWRK